MLDVDAVQRSLHEFELDAWLLYDFRGSNMLARRILDLEGRGTGSRRFFYAIPASGIPRKLVHRIEAGVLEHCPGERREYLAWRELEQGVGWLVDGMQRVAMEYSPRNANPYVSRVDAGTVELVCAQGIEVVSSGDLIQQFEATWDREQWDLHLEAARHTQTAFQTAWSAIADAVRRARPLRETEVQALIMNHFDRHGLTTDHPPIVAAGPHSGDPHFAPGPEHDLPIAEGDFVLIDLWARVDKPRAVYSDLTRVGFVGQTVPADHMRIFQLVARARDAAIDAVRSAFEAHQPIAGWQVDQAARSVIDAAGYGQYFIHRTGHSIGQETHGNGANMDNLEMCDQRRVLRRTCFSVEPGIYLAEFGVRSEVNVFVDQEGEVHVTGGTPQTEVLPILRDH